MVEGISGYNEHREDIVGPVGVVNGKLVYGTHDFPADTPIESAVATLLGAANEGLSAKVDDKLLPKVTIRPGGLVEVTLVMLGEGDSDEILEEPRSIVPLYESANGAANGGLTAEEHFCLANAEYLTILKQAYGLEEAPQTLGDILGLGPDVGSHDAYTVKAQILQYALGEEAAAELDRRFSAKVGSHVNWTPVTNELAQARAGTAKLARWGDS